MIQLRHYGSSTMGSVSITELQFIKIFGGIFAFGYWSISSLINCKGLLKEVLLELIEKNTRGRIQLIEAFRYGFIFG